MVKFALAFLSGIVILTMFRSLPHWGWILVLVAVIPIMIPIVIKYPRGIILAGLAAGFLWALFHAWLKLYPALDRSLEGVDLDVVGQIVSIPSVREDHGTRFEFLVLRAEKPDEHGEVTVPKKIRLNWFGAVPPLQLGEHWRLRVRLKRPWGFANPGGFDYERWLFGKGIRATGYVRPNTPAKRLAEGDYPVHSLRARLHQRLHAALADMDSESRAVIKALALGERSEMGHERWQMLTGTGTSHLLAISGLHVGLVSGMIYLLIFQLWKLSGPLCMRIPAQRVAALAGMAAAVTYAMLAGFSIPTQRAMIMASVVFVAVFFGKSPRPWHLLSMALFAVLIWDPYAVLSYGFWLSFAAVALIFFAFVNSRAAERSWWWRFGYSAGYLQWILALGLLPLTLMFFQQASLVSPLANLFAVPWVSFIVVPFVLLGSVLLLFGDGLAGWVFQLADYSIQAFWGGLEYLYQLPYAKWAHSPPDWVLLPAVCGVLLLLLPRKWFGKAIGLVLLSPLIFAQSTPLPDGKTTFSVLDVGQGLAVVVEAGDRVLLYDTGPAFKSGFNTGAAVIVPYLRERGIKKIDTLVIGHDDNDHAGGLEGVLENMPVAQLITSVPRESEADAPRELDDPQRPEYPDMEQTLCREGMTWRWENTRFQFLHPGDDVWKFSKNNDRSCVLLITHSGGASALITGDIERRVEWILVEEQPHLLDVDILIAPHHGSNSSSTTKFIRHTSPRYVVFASGYRNRFRFPKKEVVARYEKFGVERLNTASLGTITFTFSEPPAPALQRHAGYRDVYKRFWHSNY